MDLFFRRYTAFLRLWRSLGDSNPCFRRERATLAYMTVHSRCRKCLLHKGFDTYPFALVYTRLSPYSTQTYAWGASLWHGDCAMRRWIHARRAGNWHRAASLTIDPSNAAFTSDIDDVQTQPELG